MPRTLLIYGKPCSGKTTLVCLLRNLLPQYKHIDTDFHFIDFYREFLKRNDSMIGCVDQRWIALPANLQKTCIEQLIDKVKNQSSDHILEGFILLNYADYIKSKISNCLLIEVINKKLYNDGKFIAENNDPQVVLKRLQNLE